jgi:hypothetical protein
MSKPETTSGGAKIHRVTVGFTDQHKRLMDDFQRHTEELTWLVLEIVRDEPKLLLSPVFRKMMADKAEMVQGLHQSVKGHLYVDLQP